MITRQEIDELYEWAKITKFPLYKLNNPEHYSNKRIDYSWNKLVDHKNKSTIRKKFMTERIIEIHQNHEILWSAIGVFYAGTKVNKHKDPNIFSEPYKRIQIPIKIPDRNHCFMIWDDKKVTWKEGVAQTYPVMDVTHEGYNLSTEPMEFVMIDVKMNTQLV